MDRFPEGFFDRADPSPDPGFYASPRLVHHIDERAVEAVGTLYDELGVAGDVLDLMSSWVSHVRRPPRSLTVLGLNEVELAANPMATARVVQDLNADARLPFADASPEASTSPSPSSAWPPPGGTTLSGRSGPAGPEVVPPGAGCRQSSPRRHGAASVLLVRPTP